MFPILTCSNFNIIVKSQMGSEISKLKERDILILKWKYVSKKGPDF